MSRRPFVRGVSTTRWYLRQPRYLHYMSREITCVFIGALAVLLLVAVARLAQGPEAYAAFLASLRGPWSTLGLLAILAFAVHNSRSWFRVAPKAMPVQVGERFLPARLVVIAHYLVWLLVTVAVLLFAGVR